MIDLKLLRADPERYRAAATHKRISVNIDRLLELDTQHRAAQTELQEVTAEKNKIGKQIGQLAGRLKKAPADQAGALRAEMQQLQQRPAELKQTEQDIQTRLTALEPELNELLLSVPQPADDESPIGHDDQDNAELRTWGDVPTFDFEPKDHVALGTALGMIDIERGVKLAGTRSYVLKGAGTLLHQAVLRFALDMMIERGFTPLTPPVLVREPAMRGTGFFPLGREQTYSLDHEDPPVYLVGTAEVPLTSYHMGETLDHADLPLKYVAQSPCFRREAGTYGKDTAGLYRIHQFDKVEQVVICPNDPELSREWHTRILENSEALLQALKMPYRVVRVCTGDLGQGQAAKYDIETWMPSRSGYCETHSASRFYDFQARRLNLRYRDAKGTTHFCHTLNNTVAASPRILIPLMELNQDQNGAIHIPEVLQPYINKMQKIS